MKLKNKPWFIIFVLLLLVPNVAALWAGGVTVENTNGSFLYSVNLSNSSGTNDPTHIYFNGSCNSDCSNIYPTLNGAFIQHYIKPHNLELVLNLTGNGTVRILFGDSGISSSANGTATFLAYHGPTTSNYNDNTTYGFSIPYNNVTYESRFRRTSTTGSDLALGISDSGDTIYGDAIGFEHYYPTTTMYGLIYNNNAQSNVNSVGLPGTNVYATYRIDRYGTAAHFFVNNTEISTGVGGANLPNTNMALSYKARNGTGEFLYAYAIPYVSPMMTMGNWTIISDMSSYNAIPPTPINLSQTNTSAGAVNFTWESGSGNGTDCYNVLIGSTWTNCTVNTYNNGSVDLYGYRNITVIAVNSTSGYTSDSTSLNVYVDYDKSFVKFDTNMVDISEVGGFSSTGTPFEWTHYRMRYDGMTRGADTYLLKAINDSGDFTYYFSHAFDTASGTAAKGSIVVLGDIIDDTYGGYINSTAGNGLILNYTDDGSVFTLSVLERNASTLTTHWTQQIGGSGFDGSTLRYIPLYYTVSRIGTTLNVSIFKDHAREKLVYSSGNKTLSGVTNYPYFFLGSSYNDAGSGTSNGWVGELFVDDVPPALFKEDLIRRPFQSTDNESFELGFPSGSESWTNGSRVPVGVSSNWSSDGTYSLYMDSVNGSSESSAYFTVTTPLYLGGVAEAVINITYLPNGESTELLGIYSNAGTVKYWAYAVNESGAIYVRLGEYEGSNSFSTSTEQTVSLNTPFKVMITDHSTAYSGQDDSVVLYVNDSFADWRIHVDDTTIERVYVGAQSGNSTYYGGRFYIDNVRWRYGSSLFPGVARGGTNKDTLIYTYAVADLHGLQAQTNNTFWKSTDNGETWTYLSSLNTSGESNFLWMRWNPYNETMYVFNLLYTAVDGWNDPHSRVYTLNLTTGNLTLINNLDSQGLSCWITPTRQFFNNTDLLIGFECFVNGAASSVTEHSGRWNFTTNNFTDKYLVADYADAGTHYNSGELTFWYNATNILFALIRLEGMSGSDCVGCQWFSYKNTTNGGSADWITEPNLAPGRDWDSRGAFTKPYILRNRTWWQGRDGFQKNTGPIDRTYVTSAIWVADMNPDSNGLLPMYGEASWLGLDETGNGDIDGNEYEVGKLHLDVAFDIYSTAAFMRLQTGEMAMSQFSSWANNQTSDNTLYLNVSGSSQSILFNATADDDLLGECAWVGATEVSCSGANTSATQLFDSEGTYYVNLSSIYSNNSLSWQIIVDFTPPSGVTNVSMETGNFYINNTWTQPGDADLNHTMFMYVNETIISNVSAGIESLNLTWSPHYEQNISAQTVDVYGNINQTKVWFNVTIPNNNPVLASIGNINAVEGDTINFTMATTDADDDAITNTSNNTNGTFTAGTGNFNWVTIIGDAGTYIWNFTVDDGNGGTDIEVINVTVLQDLNKSVSVYNNAWQYLLVNDTMTYQQYCAVVGCEYISPFNTTLNKFLPHKSGTSQRATQTVIKGWGVLVKVSTNKTIPLRLNASYSWDLIPGYNLVGITRNTTLGAINSSVNTNCEVDILEYTDSATQNSYVFVCGNAGNASQTVRVGEGIWMNATTERSWTW